MRRVLPIFATIFAGATLLFLIVQVVLSKPGSVEAKSPTPEQVTELDPQTATENDIEAASMEVDPVVRMAEIAQLRESRGTVLAGTILAGAESSDDFNVALAQFTGTDAPPVMSRKEEVISLLLRTAHELDEHAYHFEKKRSYSLARELRDCARKMRKCMPNIEGTSESNEAMFNMIMSQDIDR